MNAPITLKTEHGAMHFMPTATCDYVFIVITLHFDDQIVERPQQACYCDLSTHCVFTATTPVSTLLYFMPREKKKSNLALSNYLQ